MRPHRRCDYSDFAVNEYRPRQQRVMNVPSEQEFGGVTLRPLSMTILSVELGRITPVNPFSTEFTQELCVHAEVLDMDTGKPIPLQFSNIISSNDRRPLHRIVREMLLEMCAHEIDELLRDSTGKHYRDPHGRDQP